MALHKWSEHPVQATPKHAADLIVDTRRRIAIEQAEATERRQGELAEQTAMRNTPEMRIRVWERLHGLELPARAGHPLLEVVAKDTELSLQQVQEEQRQRTAARTAPSPEAA